MGIEIRPARDSDLDEIAKLELVSFESPWKREFFVSELVAPGRYNRVATDLEYSFVGYLFSMFILDEMHVTKIAVIESARRKGVARMLIEDTIRFGLDQGIRHLSLEVRESNKSAIEFYKTLWFDVVYRRRAYYPDGEAAIVMKREI